MYVTLWCTGTLNEHTCESWTVELVNRWIRLSCWYNVLYNTCPLYTHV